MDSLRLWFNKILGRETVLEVALLGVPLRLAVQARREIRRIRSISNEAAFIERMLGSLAQGDVVYDVGANIGLLGLILSQHPTSRASRVHCFEPEPKNLEQLRRNIRENELGGAVVAHGIALADERGEIELFVRGGAGEGRHSTVVSRGSTGSIQIQAETAAAFAASLGEPPDVVKIDVEGAEGRVLLGMESLLQDGYPRELFLELHPKGERDRMPGGTPVEEWLAERGYEPTWELERGRCRHSHYRRRS